MNETNKHNDVQKKDDAIRALAERIISVLHSKGAIDVKLLHVEKSTIIADYYVICTGSSSTHIQTLANEVEYQMTKAGIAPNHSEGKNTADWILLDFSSVILHVFSLNAREFYKLEKLWSEATDVDISHLLPEQQS